MEELNRKTIDRAVLVGLNADCFTKEETATETTLDELEALLNTAGGECAGKVLQNKHTPDPRSFIGEGKAEEVRQLVLETGANMVIFDNDLTPSQTRTLEDILKTTVLDRSALILDIFAQRAKTAEGRLQVSLAQLKYQSGRLIGQGLVLSRLAGGIGTRGPGESKLEVNRRRIRERLTDLRRELDEMEKQRTLRRQSREKGGVPVVALVGYTNAGKSTLLNAITGAGIPANDRLFDTLDTTTRLLTVSDTLDVVISDTVGFIRKLPHQLVEAFKATLEELEYADLLLHVIDVSNPEWREQARIVDELIRELGAEGIPCIRVYNKCDVAFTAQQEREKDAVYISARTGEGIPALLEAVDKRLDKGTKRVVIHLPYDKAGLLDGLYREAKVEGVEYGETVDVTAVCTPRIMGRLKAYIEGWVEPKEDWE